MEDISKILIFTRDARLHTQIDQHLTKTGLVLRRTNSQEDLIHRIQHEKFSLILLDSSVLFPPEDRFLTRIQMISPESLLILIAPSPFNDEGTSNFGNKIFDCITKPIEPESLLKTIFKAVYYGRYRPKNYPTENKLLDLANNLQMVLANIDEGYFEVDLSGKILAANESMHRIFGFAEKQLIGTKGWDIFAPNEKSDIKRFFEKIRDGGLPLSYQGSVATTHGMKIKIKAFVAPIYQGNRIAGFKGIVNDQTAQTIAQEEKSQLENQLHQSQKMEAIGTLAGGIAHDFNNILSAIIGYTEITIQDIAPNTLISNNLERILNAGKRARDLIRQILTFSRHTERELLPISIQPIVKEALKLLRASLPTTIRIETRLDSNATAMADPTQIHQILINLCTNAHHAMQKQGGILKVSMKDTDLSASFCSRYPDITPGRYLKIQVTDTGVGISPEITKKIFEPFFTTKERGKGTGMGLAVVHGIVKSHNGLITVSSDIGIGTTFDVYIPVAAPAPEPILSDILGPLPTGSEHILFVDDEIVQKEMARQMLERLGYRVSAHHCSQEALSLFHHRPDQFDLVITDMTMPKITGDVLAQEIMLVRPDIPIILCTGYSDRVNEEKALSMGAKGFMMKPFLMKEMALLIRNILEAA